MGVNNPIPPLILSLSKDERLPLPPLPSWERVGVRVFPTPAQAGAHSQPTTKPLPHPHLQTYRHEVTPNEVALSLKTSAALAGYGSSSGSTGTSINVGPPEAKASPIASLNSPSSDA